MTDDSEKGEQKPEMFAYGNKTPMTCTINFASLDREVQNTSAQVSVSSGFGGMDCDNLAGCPRKIIEAAVMGSNEASACKRFRSDRTAKNDTTDKQTTLPNSCQDKEPWLPLEHGQQHQTERPRRDTVTRSLKRVGLFEVRKIYRKIISHTTS